MAGAAIPDVYAPPMPATTLGNMVKTFLQKILDITHPAPQIGSAVDNATAISEFVAVDRNEVNCSMNSCPCGSGRSLEECCGQYFESRTAPTAAALMRSRYCAHVLGKAQYLADTLSVKQRADFDISEFEESHGQVKWTGLEIRATTEGGEADETGTVEFVARCRDKNGLGIHHELSTFIREEGRWVFDDAVPNPKPATRQVQKVGRNEPCPCGSGKKYKKCCGT